MEGSFTGKIFGRVDKDNVKTEGENKNKVVKFFELAYNKSSQSVVEGAVSARNYEYLWIYAHHVITYQTNYLTMHLFDQYCKVFYDRNNKKILNDISKFLNQGISLYHPTETTITTKCKHSEIQELFYDSITAMLVSSSVMKKVGRKSQFHNLIVDHDARKKKFEKLNAELGGGFKEESEENIINALLHIKGFLNEITTIRTCGEFILVDLIDIFII